MFVKRGGKPAVDVDRVALDLARAREVEQIGDDDVAASDIALDPIDDLDGAGLWPASTHSRSENSELRMTPSGLRSSWLTVPASWPSVASRSCRASFGHRILQTLDHGVKSADEFADFVSGPRLVADIEIAVADAKSGVAQEADWMGDALRYSQAAQQGQADAHQSKPNDDKGGEPDHTAHVPLPIRKLRSFGVDGGFDERAEIGRATLEAVAQLQHDRDRGVLRRETCNPAALPNDVVTRKLDVVLERRVGTAIVVADGLILLHGARERFACGQHFGLAIAGAHSAVRRVRSQGTDERKGVGRFYGGNAEVAYRLQRLQHGDGVIIDLMGQARIFTPMMLAMTTSARNGMINAA